MAQYLRARMEAAGMITLRTHEKIVEIVQEEE